MEFKIVKIDKPEEINFILGQSHFIKTVEDVYEALVTYVPGIKFGFAFCESSQKRLIRFCGTDEEMIEYIEPYSKQFKMEAKDLLQKYTESGNVESIKNEVTSKKAVDFIYDNLKVKKGKKINYVDLLKQN